MERSELVEVHHPATGAVARMSRLALAAQGKKGWVEGPPPEPKPARQNPPAPPS